MSARSHSGQRAAASGVPQVSSTFNSETGSLHQLFAPSASSTRIISMCSTPGFFSGKERAHLSLCFCKADTLPSPEWCIPVWPHLWCSCPVLFSIYLSVCTTVTHCIHFFKVYLLLIHLISLLLDSLFKIVCLTALNSLALTFEL